MTEVQKKTDLVRLTVNLIPRAHAAMLLAAQITGDSRTDTVNRALQLYAFAEHVLSQGGEILIRDKDGDMQIVKLILPVTVAGRQQFQPHAAT